MKSKIFFEWVGCGFGLAGSLLLALHVSLSGFGFALFLISNICWMVFAILIRSYGLLAMQLGFMSTSLLGLYNWVGL